MDVHNITEVAAFTTKDGSQIRELLAHRNSCIRKQSLAEARLRPGASTTPHFHPLTEEIYYLLEGTGRMRIGDETRDPGGPCWGAGGGRRRCPRRCDCADSAPARDRRGQAAPATFCNPRAALARRR